MKKIRVHVVSANNAYRIYLLMQGIVGTVFALVFTAELYYHVAIVRLDPFQLVIIGTILEATVFLMEAPTGLLADLKSRKLSIVIGYVLIGGGFIMEGSVPIFAWVALAQVIWGLGFTFTSGATEAWIVDELQGTRDTAQVFLRGRQFNQIGTFVGLGLCLLFANIRTGYTLLCGGACLSALGVWLWLVMPEEHYTPQAQSRPIHLQMIGAAKEAGQLLRGDRIIRGLLLIGVLFGAQSEGIDRLWARFVLQEFSPPYAPIISPVAWIALIKLVLALATIGGAELLQRWFRDKSAPMLKKVCFGLTAALLFWIAAFGSAPTFGLAVLGFLSLKMCLSLWEPIYRTWLNSQITNAHIRATLFSISSQADAIGQMTCGPVVGVIGNLFGLRMAFYASAAILSPALGLYLHLPKKHPTSVTQMDSSSPENC